jgi:hypothetical protein
LFNLVQIPAGDNLLVEVVLVNIGNQQITITGMDEKNPLRVALVNGSKMWEYRMNRRKDK